MTVSTLWETGKGYDTQHILGKNLMGAQVLEVSRIVVGTVLHLERNSCLMVK